MWMWEHYTNPGVEGEKDSVLRLWSHWEEKQANTHLKKSSTPQKSSVLSSCPADEEQRQQKAVRLQNGPGLHSWLSKHQLQSFRGNVAAS